MSRYFGSIKSQHNLSNNIPHVHLFQSKIPCMPRWLLPGSPQNCYLACMFSCSTRSGLPLPNINLKFAKAVLRTPHTSFRATRRYPKKSPLSHPYTNHDITSGCLIKPRAFLLNLERNPIASISLMTLLNWQLRISSDCSGFPCHWHK